jgi:hypothetical protein
LHRSMCSITIQTIDFFWWKEIEDHTDEKHQTVDT